MASSISVDYHPSQHDESMAKMVDFRQRDRRWMLCLHHWRMTDEGSIPDGQKNEVVPYCTYYCAKCGAEKVEVNNLSDFVDLWR